MLFGCPAVLCIATRPCCAGVEAAHDHVQAANQFRKNQEKIHLTNSAMELVKQLLCVRVCVSYRFLGNGVVGV